MSTNIKLFLFVLGVAAFIGGLMKAFTVLFAGLAAIIGITLAYFWNEKAFQQLNLEKDMIPPRVNFGEAVEYEVTLENRKFLPIPWLQMEDRVTEGLNFVKEGVLRKPFGREENIFSDVFGLKWFERVRRRYKVVPQKRGLFRIGPADLLFKGILGFFNNHERYDESTKLIVYPRVLPFSGQDVEPRFLFGSRPRRGWIYTDPLNPMGVRPYQNTDSFKQINWKSSARHQQLESEIYHPSYDPEIHVFLATVGGQAWWKQEVRNSFELAVTCAASITQKAFKNQYRVGFYTNSKQQGKKQQQVISPNRHSQRRVLTTLALLRPIGKGKVSRLMRNVRGDIRPGATVVIISTTGEEDMRNVLSDYASRYRLTVIWIGEDRGKTPPPGADYLYLKGDEPWDEIETIKFIK